MERIVGRPTFFGRFLLVVMLALMPLGALSAPYAALVMDARTGEVLHSRSADTRLHPASLTKMMTLYIAFEAVENGEITLDTLVTIPQQAADEPPSRLGLRAGQQIRLRYLIRAAAVRSANDAATAIGFAIEGSESAFARRMNRTAEALGMTRTTFRNAHGLTQEGHMSTARDMSTLGRHLIYDYPQYYNLFSRLTADAGIATVRHTNRRFLSSYEGADGIKTGYTRAAGFNLTASAQRGDERIIVTVFGGTSTQQRNARVAELMDMGFARAPSRVRLQPPRAPAYAGPISGRQGGTVTVSASPGATPGASRTVSVSGAVRTSLRPHARAIPPEVDTTVIDRVVAQAVEVSARDPLIPTAAPAGTVSPPPSRPASLVPAPSPPAREVLTSVSTSGSQLWAINVGRYTTRGQAERVLIRIALNESDTLDGTLRQVQSSARGHDAVFTGLTREGADLACRRLQARGTTCFMVAP